MCTIVDREASDRFCKEIMKTPTKPVRAWKVVEVIEGFWIGPCQMNFGYNQTGWNELPAGETMGEHIRLLRLSLCRKISLLLAPCQIAQLTDVLESGASGSSKRLLLRKLPLVALPLGNI